MPPIVLAGLALLHLLAGSHILGSTGQAVPASLGDAISKIATLAASGDIQAPNSVNAILSDLLAAEDIARDVLPADVAVRLDTVEQLLKASKATIANLENKQVAEFAKVTMDFSDAKGVKVDLFGLRSDSTINVAKDLGLAE